MRTWVLILSCWVAAGCGDSERSLEVRLSSSTRAELNPFGVSVGLQRVRISVQGEEANDDAVLDLAGTGPARSAVFEGLLGGETRVRVEGYDASGAVVAFGRSPVFNLDEDEQRVDISFRRNLAYIIHRPNPGQNQPARSIYALDLATRAVVERIEIPGTAPVARAITARGGRDMLVTWQDGPEGFVGLLSLDDHRFTRVITLPGVQDLAIGSENSSRGVALGRGRLTFLDLEAGTADEDEQPIGGRVIDAGISADGRRALVALDASPGLVYVDLERRTRETQTVVPNPSGVAVDASGRVAYVTSSVSRRIVAFDLLTRQARTLQSGFEAPVELAVFSEALRAVLGVDRSNRLGRILSFNVPSQTALPASSAVETLEDPTGMASDGTGRRVVVVAAGSSTQTAGLTIIDSFADRLEGSSRLYPGDDNDTFIITPGSPDRDPVEGRQRYQPASVAVAYGR